MPSGVYPRPASNRPLRLFYAIRAAIKSGMPFGRKFYIAGVYRGLTLTECRARARRYRSLEIAEALAEKLSTAYGWGFEFWSVRLDLRDGERPRKKLG